MTTPVITVIGSINTDLITVTSRVCRVRAKQPWERPSIPSLAEKVQTRRWRARLGANVQMIGAVGEDLNGADMLKALAKENIATSMINTVPDKNTGIANIILSEQDNRIIIVPGANDTVTPEYVRQFKDEILKSDLVLLQFEIPMETILFCLDLCAANKVPVIVNPAPAREIPSGYWEKAAYITPNEGEAAQLFDFDTMSPEFNEKLIITQGDKGVSYSFNNKRSIVPAYTVTPVDTTGAGDTFNGALSVALSEKKDLETAIKFANAASALSIQKFGAQEGMPTREEVDAFLKRD